MIAPVLQTFACFLEVLVSNTLLVVLTMTYAIMPVPTRLFAAWLEVD
jgi:antibiotic biosynthesis monooxygenase (ABM) superfamily enzyme